MKQRNTQQATVKPRQDTFLTTAVNRCLGVSITKGTPKTKSIKRKPVIAALAKILLSLRYSVEVKGLETLNLRDDKGIIFLPNHPAMIDPVIVMATLYTKFSPRPLSDTTQVSKPLIRQIMKIVKPITLPDLSKRGRQDRTRVKQAINEVTRRLKNNEQIIMYPAGRLYRSAQENLAGNSGVQTILKNVPDVQVVLIRTSGLWGSSFSRASGREPSFTGQLKRYLLVLFGNALFFTPRRKVTLEIRQDNTVCSFTDRGLINRYLEIFYNATAHGNTFVPYYCWQKQKLSVLPESIGKSPLGTWKKEKYPPPSSGY